MLDIATFRAIIPQFADPAKYPDVGLQFWLDQGKKQLSARVWGDRLDLALAYFVAHSVALGERTTKSGGATGGVVASKSIGPGSISYNTTLGTHEGAGSYNLTPYGVRLWEMMQLVGMGSTQLSPASPFNPNSSLRQDGSTLYSGLDGLIGIPGGLW